MAAGDVLTAVSLTLANDQGTQGMAIDQFGTGRGPNGRPLEVLTVLSPGTGSLNSSYGAGTYNFYHSGFGSINGSGSGAPLTANYVFSLTVTRDATVPEPTSLALAGSALAGLVLARRRAQRRPAPPCPHAAPLNA